MQIFKKRLIFHLTLKYMAFSKGNRSIRNARRTQLDYFYKCRNGALLALCTYSRSQHSRHYSVWSHNQNVTSALLVRPPRHTAHCRTGFFQLVPLFISRPDRRRAGSRDWRNSLDFSLDNRDIAARFPGRASNFTVFQIAQTGFGADPLSFFYKVLGAFPKE